MKTEYEATFLNIDKEEFIKKLSNNHASLERKEFIQRRVTLELPEGKRDQNTWLRVRDEGDKITLTLKSVTGLSITGQKEILVEVKDFNETLSLLMEIGCEKKSYQESKRELWKLDGVEIMIDTWPFLEPYVEIEGQSEEDVEKIAAQLGFNYAEASFDTVNTIYKKKYGKTLDELNKEVLKNFTFEIKNPFL